MDAEVTQLVEQCSVVMAKDVLVRELQAMKLRAQEPWPPQANGSQDKASTPSSTWRRSSQSQRFSAIMNDVVRPAVQTDFHFVQARVPLDLIGLLDERGRIVWRVENTLAFMILQRDTAKYLMTTVVTSVSGLAVHSAIVGIYGVTIVLGLFKVVPPWAFLASCGVLFCHLLSIAAFLMDLRIAWVLARRPTFIANFVLVVCGMVAVSALLQFDERSALVPVATFIVMCGLVYDALPSFMRHYVGFPFTVFLVLLVSGFGVTVNLQRFPGQVSLQFTVGNLWGIASQNIYYDVLSLASSSILAFLWIAVFMFLSAYRGRRNGQLSSLVVPIISVDAPGTMELMNPDLVRRFPWLNNEERGIDAHVTSPVPRRGTEPATRGSKGSLPEVIGYGEVDV